MNRTRTTSIVRFAAAGLLAAGVLLGGASLAIAAPVSPTGAATPVQEQPPVATLPPRPTVTLYPCTPGAAKGCTQPPTATLDPCAIRQCPTLTTKPSETTRPTRPTRPTKTTSTTTSAPPVAQPSSNPVGIPVPNRVETGGGDSAVSVNPWLIAVPALLLLTLIGLGATWFIGRTDRSRA
jgi:hypothetical protein